MNKTIAIPICLIATVALGMGVISPKYKEYEEKLAQTEAKRVEVEDAISYYKEVNEVSARLDKYSREISKIDLALPGEVFAPDLFDYFQKKAIESNLVLEDMGDISGSVSQSYPNLWEYQASLSLAGSYRDLKDFLKILYNSSRFLEVETISFHSPEFGAVMLDSPDEEGSSFLFNLSVKFYSHQ